MSQTVYTVGCVILLLLMYSCANEGAELGVFIHGDLEVDEGGVEILSPDIITINNTDRPVGDFFMVIDVGPEFGFLEVRDRNGVRRISSGDSVPLSTLLDEQLSYVQSDHQTIEPRRDSFQFHLTDSLVISARKELVFRIEDINDEPPRVTVNPLLVVKAETLLQLTSDHIQILDMDTDALDISLTLIEEPASGKLHKYDRVTSVLEPLQRGTMFYYQDLLDGDVSLSGFNGSTDQFQLQASDGKFSELVTLKISKKTEQEIQMVTVNPVAVPCIMQFAESEMLLEESISSAQILVTRSGDMSGTCSIICSTRSGSATAPADYDERQAVESSRIFFLRGVTMVACPLVIHDDQQHEGVETLAVRLTQPQVENVTAVTFRASVGPQDQLLLRLRDDEDVTRVQFGQPVLGLQDTENSIQVNVLRTGDLAMPSKITVSTRDRSAKAGLDYQPLSKLSITFAAGETLANFQLSVIGPRPAWLKELVVFLETVSNAQPGNIASATIVIPAATSSGPTVLPAEPIVTSLMYYDQVKSNKPVPAGYPVVCVAPCDPKYPSYNSTQRFCQAMGLDISKIRFSWEIARPASDGEIENSFVRITRSTLFSSVEERVLDAVYFGYGHRLRCAVHPVPKNGLSGVASRSRPVTVTSINTPCPVLATNGAGGGQQPFRASLSRVNESSGNGSWQTFMKIHIQLPHVDGSIPVLSTQPLHSLAYVLSDPAYRLHHKCSNLQPGFGFLDEKSATNSSRRFTYEFSKSLRQESAIRLYRHLDFNSCLWNFEAWYSMTDLVDLCGGQVQTDQKSKGVAQLSVRVPLHVAVVTTGTSLDWSYVEHETEMEFSFSYNSVLWHDALQSAVSLTPKLHVNRVHADPNGRLIIDFQTEARFAGSYVAHHPTDHWIKSQLVSSAASPVHFQLELISSRQNNGIQIQKWRAVSNYTLSDYSGNYTLHLIPCLLLRSPAAAATAPVSPTQPNPSSYLDAQQECQAVDAVNVTLTVAYQQAYRPSPVNYSLQTAFQLTNDVGIFLNQPRSIDDIQDNFSEPFRLGQVVYGRVMWHPGHDLSPGYDLTIDKVFMCAGRDGYVPVYEPNAERPQFGCMEKSAKLKYRILLLDRDDPYAGDKEVQGVAIKANLASQVEQLRPVAQMAGVDGFAFGVDPLFRLESGLRWFLQVTYSVQPTSNSASRRWKRSAAESVQRYSTDLRPLPLDWTSAAFGPRMIDWRAALPILIAAALFCLLVVAAFTALCLYYQSNSRKRITRQQPTSTLAMKTLSANRDAHCKAERVTLV